MTITQLFELVSKEELEKVFQVTLQLFSLTETPEGKVVNAQGAEWDGADVKSQMAIVIEDWRTEGNGWTLDKWLAYATKLNSQENLGYALIVEMMTNVVPEGDSFRLR